MTLYIKLNKLILLPEKHCNQSSNNNHNFNRVSTEEEDTHNDSEDLESQVAIITHGRQMDDMHYPKNVQNHNPELF